MRKSLPPQPSPAVAESSAHSGRQFSICRLTSGSPCSQLPVFQVNQHSISGLYTIRKDQSGCQRLHMLLNIPFQRAGTIYGVIRILHDKVRSLLCQLQLQISVLQPAVQVGDNQVSLVSGLKRMVSSSLFRNSGRKWPRSSFITAFSACPLI